MTDLTHGKLRVTDNNHSNDDLTLTPSIWEVNGTPQPLPQSSSVGVDR